MPKKLQDDKNVKMTGDYAVTLEMLINTKRKELDNLKHQSTVLVTENNRRQTQFVREESEFRKRLRHEGEEAKSKNDQLGNSLIARENALALAEQDMVKRNKSLAEAEIAMQDLEKKRQNLAIERVEIEKLRSNIAIRADNVENESSKADTALANANQAEARAKEAMIKYDSLNSKLIAREDACLEKEKDIALSKKNISEAQKAIEPKIEELKATEKNIEKKLAEVQKIEESIIKLNVENQAMAEALSVLDKKAQHRERSLEAREHEIERKSILAGIKKAEEKAKK